MLDLIQALVNGLSLGAVFALAAVGLTLVFGVMNVPNFAHGEFIMLAMYVAFFMWALWGLDPLASIPIAAAVLATVGFLLYRGVIRRVIGTTPLAQIIVTFGLLTLLRGLAQFLWTPDTRRVDNPAVRDIRLAVGGVVLGGPQLAIIVGALGCTGAVAWLIHRTELGHAIQAAGEDPAAAALMGINPNRMYALVWTLAGATTGVAGALLLNQFAVDPLAGATFGLISFVAVALGGFGSVSGAAIAGVVLGVIQAVVGLYIPAYTLAAALAVYLLVLVVRPQGLRGMR